MLYIIVKDYFLANYVVDAIKDDEGISTIGYARKNNARGLERLKLKVKKYLRAFVWKRKGIWTADIFEPDMLARLKSITREDDILLWGVENLKELLIMEQELEYNKMSVFLWNPVSTICRNAYSQWEYSYYLRNSGMDVFTFDGADAERYGFNQLNQVYRKKDGHQDESISTDVFFIGQDKARAVILNDMMSVMDSQGISHDFYIIKDKHTRIIPRLEGCYHDNGLTYEESLQLLERSRCVIEIFQRGQDGITLRTLESAFMGKKLITNNRNIVSSDLYNPSNIYIWGDKSEKRTLREFMDIPVVPVPVEILSRYDVRYWIQRFL